MGRGAALKTKDADKVMDKRIDGRVLQSFGHNGKIENSRKSFSKSTAINVHLFREEMLEKERVRCETRKESGA